MKSKDLETMSESTTNPSIPQFPNSLNPRDLVPLAVSTIGLAIMLGTAIMTVFLLLNRSMVKDLPLTPDARPDAYQPAATMLLVGVLCTLVIPMVTAWGLLGPIEVSYRRFGFAMVSGLGALVVSILAVPANEFLGTTGLLALLALALITCLFLGRRVWVQRSAL
jgi:lysylphosphatidylglycerol synthetase-like protein (DUF2156 family)